MNDDVVQQLIKMVAHSNEMLEETLKIMKSMTQEMKEFRAEMNERFECVEDLIG
jgi:hypothetical protein